MKLQSYQRFAAPQSHTLGVTLLAIIKNGPGRNRSRFEIQVEIASNDLVAGDRFRFGDRGFRGAVAVRPVAIAVCTCDLHWLGPAARYSLFHR